MKKLPAEFIGTFWLVLGGCGSAVIAAQYPNLGIGFLGVALAFGISLWTMAAAIGPISGCHVNPAISVGMCLSGRMPWNELGGYVVAQVAGAVSAAITLFAIAKGSPSFSMASGFATNGYGAHSPGGYAAASCFLAEVVLTAGFFLVVALTTDKKASAGFAPSAVGLALTLVHLVGIPITNTSVNPARSTGVALVHGGWALQQLWMFWLAPFVGALVGAAMYKFLVTEGSTAARPTGLGIHHRRPIEHPV